MFLKNIKTIIYLKLYFLKSMCLKLFILIIP